MGFKGIKNHQIFFKMNELETQIFSDLHKCEDILLCFY